MEGNTKKIYWRTMLVLMAIMITTNCYSQLTKVNRILLTDENMKNLLRSADTVVTKRSMLFNINVLKVINGSTSVVAPKSNDVTHRMLFVVSSYGNHPGQNIYDLGDFYNPKISHLFSLPSGILILVIEYGASDKRLARNYQISETNVF